MLALLREKGLTFGTAESCTGGLIAKRITDLPGASAAFRGGVVSYATQVKHDLLGVDQALLDRYGAVSEPVAAAMAEGARRALGCDIAVASTGVAGPDPDDRGNPVGLVYLALAAPEGTWGAPHGAEPEGAPPHPAHRRLPRLRSGPAVPDGAGDEIRAPAGAVTPLPSGRAGGRSAG